MKNWNSGIRAPDKELETKAGMLSKHKKMFSGSATQQFCAPKLGNSDRNLEGYSNPKMVRAQVTPFYALGIPSLRAESAIVIPTMCIYIYIICIFYIYIYTLYEQSIEEKTEQSSQRNVESLILRTIRKYQEPPKSGPSLRPSPAFWYLDLRDASQAKAWKNE